MLPVFVGSRARRSSWPMPSTRVCLREAAKMTSSACCLEYRLLLRGPGVYVRVMAEIVLVTNGECLGARLPYGK